MADWMEGPRWRREQELVLAAYPSAKAHSATAAGDRKFWTLQMSPITSADRLPYVLADLAANRPVCMRPDGEVGHSADCEGLAGDHAQYHVNIPRNGYTVRLDYPAREHQLAGPVHPKARVVMPAITALTMPHHPHLFTTQDRSDSWACPIAPHDADWTWCEGSTVSYLDQVAIWLLKTIVWWRTGGGILSFGRWLGEDATHDPLVLLSTDPESACPCGSGQGYGNCCHERHLNEAMRRLGSTTGSRQPTGLVLRG